MIMTQVTADLVCLLSIKKKLLEKAISVEKVDHRITVIRILLNPFHATSLFLYPLKTSENQNVHFQKTFLMFSWGCRKRPVA